MGKHKKLSKRKTKPTKPEQVQDEPTTCDVFACDHEWSKRCGFCSFKVCMHCAMHTGFVCYDARMIPNGVYNRCPGCRENTLLFTRNGAGWAKEALGQYDTMQWDLPAVNEDGFGIGNTDITHMPCDIGCRACKNSELKFALHSTSAM